MARKQRSDSAKAAIDAAVAVTQPPLRPPANVRLRDGDEPFWDSIIKSRARAEWVSEADLIVAAQLARCMADIEAEQIVIETEGSVIDNARGTAVMNPRHAILEQLARRQMAFMKCLSMTGVIRVGDKRGLAGARAAEAGARQARSTVTTEGDGEDLLA